MQKKYLWLLIFSNLITVALGFYLGKKEEQTIFNKKFEKELSKKKSPLDEEPFQETEEPILLSNELQNLDSKDLMKGQGSAIDLGDKVLLHYVARLTSGKVFDSSKRRFQAYEVTPGSGGAILGLEMGILGMQKGGKRRILIPSHMGYGDGAGGGLVPAKSTLVYDVEILEVTSKPKEAPKSK